MVVHMEQITYRALEAGDITPGLFEGFNRFHDVRRCWRKIEGQWVLRDIAFVENWDAADYAELVQNMHHTLAAGGGAWGAFEGGRLVGFASLIGKVIGPQGEYRQLPGLFVSHESRGRGIGRALFRLAADEARRRGVGKLYISAHSSQETQAAYKSYGCVEALWYYDKLVALEPCDCQLEFDLGTAP